MVTRCLAYSLLLSLGWMSSSSQLEGNQPPAQEDPLLQGLIEEVLPDEDTKKLEPRTNSGEIEDTIPSNVDSANPLEAIQVEMIAATRFLMKGKLDRDSVRLQQEILMRMDDLIESIEKTQADAKSKKSKESSTSKQKDAKEPSSGQTKKGAGQRGESDLQSALRQDGNPGENSAAEQQPSSQPGAGGNQQSSNGQENTEGLDPDTLEKGTWGHLPERTRKQMQSNRSDRFLPKYRAQIEEYYRRLSREK